MNKIYVQHWIELPKDIREHLMKALGIPKTGIAEIRDQTLISDGITNTDLQLLTPEKLSEYVGSVDTLPRLWDLTIAKARYELNPPTIEMGVGLITQDQVKILNTPLGTTAATDPISAQAPKTIDSEKPKFCDFCESGGVRHKANCTKPGIVNGYPEK